MLRGETGGRLREAALLFAARALERTRGTGHEEALAQAAAAIESGEALERFRRMVEAQGGDPRVVDDPAGVLPAAPVREPLLADRSGVLAAVEAEEIGLASVDLGAGRRRKGDPIDPAVGIVVHPKIGDRLEAGTAHRGGARAGSRRGGGGRAARARRDGRRRRSCRAAAARVRLDVM